MTYYNEIPSGQATYLASQARWYRQEARQMLDLFKAYIHSGGSESLVRQLNYPVYVISGVLDKAKAHYNMQSILLGSSNHNALCAQIIAPAIGLDLSPELDRDEVIRRIVYLAKVIDSSKDGDFPEEPWAQVALMATLRAISSAAT